MRIPTLVLLIALGGCRCESDPLRLHLGPLGPNDTRLPDQELNTRTTAVKYALHMESLVGDAILVEASAGDGTTEGVRVSIEDNVRLLPRGKETVTLVLALPPREGPFRAVIVLTSPDLPGWKRTYELQGTMIDAPLEGRRLEVEPNGLDVGTVRAGDEKPFRFEIRSVGTEAVTLEEVVAEADSGIRLTGDDADMRLEPGTGRVVEGVFRCPEGTGERVLGRIQIKSDAINRPQFAFVVGGRRGLDYQLQPPSMPTTRTYPDPNRRFAVDIRGTGGPFVVGRVAGLEPYFELVDPLSTEPAESVRVMLRLRDGAPTSVEPAQGAVRFEVSPPARVLEWPYRLTVLPSVYPQPSLVDFGALDAARVATAPLEREIQIVSLPGRDFQVTAVESRNNLFAVRSEHRRNLPWRIVVGIPAQTKPGIYRDDIVITTDDQEVPRIVVKASAVVR